MNARRLILFRWGRCQQEHILMLAMIIVICIAGVRLLSPEPPIDPRPLWERVVASVLGLLQCFGLVIGVSLILASVEVVKQTAARYRVRRVENKLGWLEPIRRNADAHASPHVLGKVLRLMGDSNDTVRQYALSAAYSLLRAEPGLSATPQARAYLEEALVQGSGFARAMALTENGESLLQRVTLGAKLGAGTSEKRLAPVTSEPSELARWVEQHRREEANPEIQVSIGYDTGTLPYLVERSRFLALYLFISTTDLRRFQSLMRRPPRDPNAAFGLVIRGDVVEVKYPGQARGHRLDYVFPLPVRLTEANLKGLFTEIQLLNLGLLVSCVQDTCRVLFPGNPPGWLEERRQAMARVYREFEKRLVGILREYDRYREPGLIHRLVPGDHVERVRAFENYRLEECLYPQYGWVVPLYDPDTRWEKLLGPLRGVEAMLLHQGEVEGRDITRGVDFLQQVRRLGYETAVSMEQALGGELSLKMAETPGLDPFIDATREEATVWYLRQVSRALSRGECSLEDLPDPVTFRQATAYYGIDRMEASTVVRKGPSECES